MDRADHCLPVPIGLLAFEADVKALSELYAIGVVGAITINVLSCAANKELEISRGRARGPVGAGHPDGRDRGHDRDCEAARDDLRGSMILVVLGIRYFLQLSRAPRAPSRDPRAGDRVARRDRARAGGDRPRQAADHARGTRAVPGGVRGGHGTPARRDPPLAIYVRTLRLIDITPGAVPRVQDDPGALEALGSVAVLARQYDVPFVPIYVLEHRHRREILDYTVTFGCDTLVMGKTRRSLLPAGSRRRRRPSRPAPAQRSGAW
jgi:nucleotide-binding universal stress UspA family protein